MPPLSFASPADVSGGTITCRPVYFGPGSGNEVRWWKAIWRAINLLEDLT